MGQNKRNANDILVAAAIGAACTYLLDPAQGKRRRARIRDKAVHFLHAVESGSGVVARDLTNRTWGIGASLTRTFRHREFDDQVLEPRVRSEMGRWISHPHAIHVEARDGCILLSGDIPASEELNLLRRVEEIPGVKRVENRLRSHVNTENFPALQGGSRREARSEFMQTNWAPGPRTLAALSGTVMAGYGFRNRSLVGLALSLAGTLLFFRAVTNKELSSFIGAGEQAEKPVPERKPDDPGVSIKVNRPEKPEYRVH